MEEGGNGLDERYQLTIVQNGKTLFRTKTCCSHNVTIGESNGYMSVSVVYYESFGNYRSARFEGFGILCMTDKPLSY